MNQGSRMVSEIENKRSRMTMRRHTVDRLSGLCDSLLIHILSFVREPAGLTTGPWSSWFSREGPPAVKKTAVTSVLSKRWRYVWAELPVLSFQEKSIDTEKISRFVFMVNRTLAIRTAQYLEKFYLDFRFSPIWAVFVDGCLAFASKGKAKVVSLILPTGDNRVGYAIPEMFYRNSSLEELELAFCRVSPQRRIEWRGLTRLDFLGVELGDDVIENILSGCPVLYSLGLQDCWGFSRLNINSPSVGKLGVWLGEDVHLPCLEISAPYIHYLEILSVGELKETGNRKIRVRNIPCVVKALIDIRLDGSEEDWSYVMDWIEATLHIPELHLTEHLMELLGAMAESGLQIPPSHKRVSLTMRAVEGDLDKESIFGLIRLLESSPQLEKLEVFTSFTPRFGYLRNDDFSCCDLPHLKTVKIECAKRTRNYTRAKYPLFADLVILLARILLRRATALEKMLFLVSYTRATSGFKKIAGVVNSYPRSSKQAQVLVLPLC